MPCDGVDRRLPQASRAVLAASIAGQLHVPRVEVSQQFRFGRWRIVYVEPGQADPAFLFYPGDPLRTAALTQWSGAARADEEMQIRDWASANAPGIPVPLARCFAWHVSRDRDR